MANTGTEQIEVIEWNGKNGKTIFAAFSSYKLYRKKLRGDFFLASIFSVPSGHKVFDFIFTIDILPSLFNWKLYKKSMAHENLIF